MRFESLQITNFRAVRRFEIDGLSDMVVIAGPNGCGKSAIFDAIRLMKSVYGGYQPDEWRNWFGEFQIDLSRPNSVARLFRRADRPVTIRAVLKLDETERQYLETNAERLLEPLAWRQIVGRDFDLRTYGSPALATELRVHGPQVRARVTEWADELRSSLTLDQYPLELVVQTNLQIDVTPSVTLDVLFQTYDPHNLGVIDYHSASRAYEREAIGGINLNLESRDQNLRQQSLYNWQGKYRNIKTELAATYVRDLIGRQSGTKPPSHDLNNTLKELFQTFFPDKAYEGPTPREDGSLDFPVRLISGEVHDIDDLSSGEKEIVYGYLRLRNSAPLNSVILLDEPELHLNPGLLQGFPDFYHKHLGIALNNQLWLVTHSDALLRQSVGNPHFSVFHMRAATAAPDGENQALPIEARSELDRAVIDLVGDLATYKPHAKVVIFEGGGDTEFDVLVVSRLFPSLANTVNLVSGGQKRRVQDLYDVLSQTAMQAGLPDRFFAVVDRDSGPPIAGAGAHILSWDRYHIENYLVEPRYVLAAMRAVAARPSLADESAVIAALRSAAEKILPRLVLERLQNDANSRLIREIKIGAARNSRSPAAGIRPSIEGSLERITKAAQEMLADGYLDELASTYQCELITSLTSDAWMTEIPGRLILARFVEAHVSGVSYEAFRILILDKMVDDRFQPVGMKTVINQIEAAGASL